MEQKKLLWIVFSMTLFLLVVVGIGMIWLYPGPQQPVTAEETSAGREAGADFDPVEWVRSDQETVGLDEEKPGEGDEESFVVVYGEAEETEATVPEVNEVTEPAEKTGPATTYEKTPEPERTTPVVTQKPAAARPEPTSRTINVKEYWIQAGAYTSRTRADNIKQELDELGLSGRILSKDVSGTQYYRVRIGPYSEKAEADKFLAWVKQKDNFRNSYISEVYRAKTVVQ